MPPGSYRSPQDGTGAVKLRNDVPDQVSHLFSTGTVRPVRVEGEAALPDSLLVGWGAVALSPPVHQMITHQQGPTKACMFITASHTAKQHTWVMLPLTELMRPQNGIAYSRMTRHMCQNSLSIDAHCCPESRHVYPI